MREIEFRAWSKIEKKMKYYDRDCSSPNMTLNGVLIDGYGSNVSYQYILMEYTGLLDKNGKKLDWWEGDIFERTDASIDTIIFEDGCFWMWDEKHKHRQPLFECVEWSEIYTKIGNVHEPEDK